jgi:hypothetical protein
LVNKGAEKYVKYFLLSIKKYEWKSKYFGGNTFSVLVDEPELV